MQFGRLPDEVPEGNPAALLRCRARGDGISAVGADEGVKHDLRDRLLCSVAIAAGTAGERRLRGVGAAEAVGG